MRSYQCCNNNFGTDSHITRKFEKFMENNQSFSIKTCRCRLFAALNIGPRWNSSFRPDMASSSPVLGPLQNCPDLEWRKNGSDKKDLKVWTEAKGHQMKLTIRHETRHEGSSFRYSPNLTSSSVLELLQICPVLVQICPDLGWNWNKPGKIWIEKIWIQK